MTQQRGHLRSGSTPVIGSPKQFSADGMPLEHNTVSPNAQDLTRGSDALDVPHKTMRRVCCIGAGYVGGPSSAMIAFKTDIEVTVVDFNSHRIAAWKSTALPIYEPDLYRIVSAARDGVTLAQASSGEARMPNGTSGRQASVVFSSTNTSSVSPNTEKARQPNLFFSTNVKKAITDADLIFICVNTPTKSMGIGKGQAADLEYLEAATRTIAKVATASKIVVEKSSVPCRTAQHVRDILLANARPGVHFDVLSNPEFLAEGTAVADLLHPDRILIGSLSTPSGYRAAASLADIYAHWVPRDRIITMNLWSAELSKLAANAMLAQRISSVNALSAICEATGASVDEVAYACGLDSRIGPHMLKASPGFGGSCFRKDILSLVYLSESLHLKEVAAYWKTVLTMNDYQKDRFTKRIVSCLFNSLSNKRIAVLGFAFKKDTGDCRESAAITLVSNFVTEKALVSIYDPRVEEHQIWLELERECGDIEVLKRNVAVHQSPYDACMEADAIVVLTEWDEFSNKSGGTTASIKQSDYALGPLDTNAGTIPDLSSHSHHRMPMGGRGSSQFQLNIIPPSPGLQMYNSERQYRTALSTRVQGTYQPGSVLQERRKPKPSALDLGTTRIDKVEPPLSLPSGATGTVSYPGSVSSPNPYLTAIAPVKKFKYDLDFLLQFKKIYSDKPGPDWDLKVRESVDDAGVRDLFSTINQSRAGSNFDHDNRSCERLDWARIAKSMKKPMFVFDGRNILDRGKLEKLGFRVEAIGKAGKDFMQGRDFA